MTSSDTRHFLIVFDAKHGVLKDLREFAPEDVDAALDAYRDAETRFAADASIQVVLLGSDSLDSVKVTHRSFFPQPDDLDVLVR